MAKIRKVPIQATYDDELRAQGLMRSYKPEFVKRSDGSPAICYRQIIVPYQSTEDLLKPSKKVKRKFVMENTTQEVQAAVKPAKGKKMARLKTEVVGVKVAKLPRATSKLSKALDIYKGFGQTEFSKEVRLECIQSIMANLVVSKNNATIYFNKCKELV